MTFDFEPESWVEHERRVTQNSKPREQYHFDPNDESDLVKNLKAGKWSTDINQISFLRNSLSVHPVHMAKPHIVTNLGPKTPVDQINQTTQFIHAYNIRRDVANRITVPSSFGILPFKESLPAYGWGSEMDKVLL